MEGKISTNPSKLWSKDFILLTLSNMLLYLALQMIVPALPVYVVGTLHGTSFTAGIISSVFALAAVVTRTFIGKILDTASRKKIFYIGLCIYLLSMIGFYWGSIVAILVMLRIIIGIGFGFTSTTNATMVSDIIPLNRTAVFDSGCYPNHFCSCFIVIYHYAFCISLFWSSLWIRFRHVTTFLAGMDDQTCYS